MRYTRTPPDEYAEHFVRCSVCNWYIKIAGTPEGGEYPVPSSITGATFYARANACIWLAGTTTATGDATAPKNAPTEVDLDLTAAQSLVFSVPSGASFDGVNDADGDTSDIITASDANSIGGLVAPDYSLVGVFLTDSAASGVAPASLDFTLLASRDYTALVPALEQPFYVGTGRTADDDYRTVTVPTSATRLFVACHTEYWSPAVPNVRTIRGIVHQASSTTYTNSVDSISSSGVYINDRAAATGCPHCGSPAWRRGGKPGDLKSAW